MIQKMRTGTFVVKSSDGKKLLGGPYRTKAEAQKRIAQVEWYKAHPKK